MPWSKTLKRDVPIYAPDYIADFRKKEVKQYLAANNLTKQQYIAEVRDEVNSNKKLISDIVRKDQNKEAQQRFREKKKQLKVKAASKIQTAFLRNKLFRMTPTVSAWDSYNKYTLYNDRPSLYMGEFEDWNVEHFMTNLKKFIEFYKVRKFIQSHTGKKVWLSIECNQMRRDDNGDIIDVSDDNGNVLTTNFTTKSKLILWANNSDVDFILNNMYYQLENYLDHPYTPLLSVNKLEIHVAKVNALTGSSYLVLPKIIANKNAIININNTDNKCFLYSVLCGLKCPKDNANLVSNYTDRLTELKYKDEEMPMDLNKIIFFEKRNDVRINVYGLYNNNVVLLYVSSISHREELKYINLFYHTHIKYNEATKKDEVIGHYSYIKHFNRLFGEKGKKRLVCQYCCQFKTTQSTREKCEKAMENHMKYCISGQKVEMPDEK
jgi:hypothetical protein